MAGDWAVHTFVVLDDRTVKDKTCYLCCDAPDFLEEVKVMLKKLRSDFAPIAEDALCYETFTRCPSEAGARKLLETGQVLTKEVNEKGDQYLSIMPPCLNSTDRRNANSYGTTNKGAVAVNENQKGTCRSLNQKRRFAQISEKYNGL